MLKKFIPHSCYKSIYDINFTKLYDSGIRVILTDLDNTLISYNETKPDEKLINLKNELINMGFKFIIVSNSRKNRATNFAKLLGVDCIKFSTKPLKRGIKKGIKLSGETNLDSIVLLGDQLMTDVLGANRTKIKPILIKAVDKSSDKLPTRLNRKLEKMILKRIKNKFPKEYEEKIKEAITLENI